MRASAGESSRTRNSTLSPRRAHGVRFSHADRVLISSPMSNFGVPYKLKQWFDLIVQPGITFTFSPAEGYRGW